MSSPEVSIRATHGTGRKLAADEASSGEHLAGAGAGAGKVDPETALYNELWHACAGPLVTVPRENQLVFYFPQGHIEQVEASTNQVADQQMPVYNLPWKILCRVVNVELKAEPDTDEVYAQVMLHPLSNRDENSVEKEPPPPPPPRFVVHAFCKTLTASDTSTHGGFSVLRRHADECLPPLDMSRQPPTQELVAKDLHGNEWRFRHIFRGQPRRHLLQSGWSVFVSSKRLVAGDAFIFLRGENGDLRVGVRRAMRQQGVVPSSVISSHSMHLGVLATAWHAISTGTMFTVYYKPSWLTAVGSFLVVCVYLFRRLIATTQLHVMASYSDYAAAFIGTCFVALLLLRTSPAQFIVPFEQYMGSMKSNYSIGMRFKMRFEGEESPEQRFTGTIVGIDDADPKRWRESKWRCLKIRWDETSTIPRPDRVSPWQIEPAMTPPTINSLSVPRAKRPRPSVVTPSADSSVLTREGSSKVIADPLPASGFSRVLQGQEYSTLKTSIADSNESETVEKPNAWPSSVDEEKVDNLSASRKYGPENWTSSVRPEPTYADLLSGFGMHSDQRSGFHSPYRTAAAALPMKRHLQEYQDGRFNMLSGPWSMMPASLSLNLSESGVKGPSQNANVSYRVQGDGRYGSFGEMTVLQGHRVDNHGGNWLMPPPGSSRFENYTQSREFPVRPMATEQGISKPKDGNCKLFGIPLISTPGTQESSALCRRNADDPATLLPPVLEHVHDIESDQSSEYSKGSKQMDNMPGCNERENKMSSSQLHSRDAQAKSHSGSSRSCTKVHKQGIALGRSVDLSKFNGYDELVAELDRLFDFSGELKAPEKNWLIVYTDDEGDMMLVGDDPWQEFCCMVRKIFIYTKEEVQKMTPRTLISQSEENPPGTEGVDSKEVR